jgi:hypothetical protein
LNSIHMHKQPNGDPSGFRDRLLCYMLKEDPLCQELKIGKEKAG